MKRFGIFLLAVASTVYLLSLTTDSTTAGDRLLLWAALATAFVAIYSVLSLVNKP